jgi:predicted acylesterase/phospholipase RssA
MGGLTFIGAWKALEHNGLTANIVNFSGCSFGSIVALLTSIGYSSNELEEIVLGLRYKDFADFQVLHTFETLGLDTGNEFKRLLRKLVHHKTGYHDITFGMHHTITGRDLWVNASCLELDNACYFSRYRSPDMSIIKAVRMSISLPIIMGPVKYRGLTFIDGGFHDPCPVGMFQPDGTLVLHVLNNNELGLGLGHGSGTETDRHEFIKYLEMIMGSIYKRLYSNHELKTYNVVWLDSKIGITLDGNRATKRRLITVGYNTLLRHLNPDQSPPP